MQPSAVALGILLRRYIIETTCGNCDNSRTHGTIVRVVAVNLA
jgi:hypothetical protein